MHLGITSGQWKKFSEPERYNHIKALKGHFELYLREMFRATSFEGEIQIDAEIFIDVVRHYYTDLKRMRDDMESDPNEFKQKAIYAFWIRRLKPVYLTEPLPEVAGEAKLWVNEAIGITIVLTELDIVFGKTVGTDIDQSLKHDLLYFFRYKSVSPHSLYLILASLYRDNIHS